MSHPCVRRPSKDEFGLSAMIEKPEELMQEFVDAALKADLIVSPILVEHETQRAPHHPHSLPPGKCAVYVFSISTSYGEGCRAGVHRVLKVGKAGPNSNARFQSQHYNPGSAPSTLGATLVNSTIFWPYLGISHLAKEKVGAWIRENTDRDNFYLDSSEQELLGTLEKFLRGMLGPVFEGG